MLLVTTELGAGHGNEPIDAAVRWHLVVGKLLRAGYVVGGASAYGSRFGGTESEYEARGYASSVAFSRSYSMDVTRTGSDEVGTQAPPTTTT